ncbi:zinc ribbon domain-containing protein [Microseira sp. BLCC-F43]|jgi:putative transposase|uniref:zinc ribbon domain-containing protein n=1 Tax=Microseira sp. BLCC-F43 TaxID=3153602 RepID=UPI0035BB40E9
MIANQKLAQAISSLGFYEFRRMLIYKAIFFGTKVELVDRWFASSKTCSCCGNVQPMPLLKRIYKCGNCGVSIDCDLNAAIDLENAPKNPCTCKKRGIYAWGLLDPTPKG